MEDIKKICPCGATFFFTVRDQEFYQKKGFEPPKRCKPCRFEKKKSFGDKPYEHSRPT